MPPITDRSGDHVAGVDIVMVAVMAAAARVGGRGDGGEQGRGREAGDELAHNPSLEDGRSLRPRSCRGAEPKRNARGLSPARIPYAYLPLITGGSR